MMELASLRFLCIVSVLLFGGSTVAFGQPSDSNDSPGHPGAKEAKEIMLKLTGSTDKSAVNYHIPVREGDHEYPFSPAEANAGWHILHVAVVDATDEAVEWLLSQGADANAVTVGEGVPVMHLALADECRPEKVRLLLEAGADPNASDAIEGRRAFAVHLAVQHHDLRCLNLLVKHGADISSLDEAGRNAYFYAVDRHNKHAIWHLWELGLDPMTKDNRGIDAIHYSASIYANETSWMRHWLFSDVISEIYDKALNKIEEEKNAP